MLPYDRAGYIRTFDYIQSKLRSTQKVEVQKYCAISEFWFFIISSIAGGILLKSELCNFLQSTFLSDSEYLPKNSDILFLSDYKREI